MYAYPLHTVFGHARTAVSTLFLVAGLALAAASPVKAQSFDLVPGVKIAYLEYNDKVFLGTPSITIAPNGDYYVSHDFFGDDASPQDEVDVYRSTDGGATWTLHSSITGAFHATIFHYNGDMYLFSTDVGDPGDRDIVIRKWDTSTSSWSAPSEILSGDYPGHAATIPAVYGGRIWLARGGKAVMSAPTDANLLSAGSWAYTGDASISTNPWSAPQGDVTEGQIVASPINGVTIMPKIGDFDGSGVIRVNPNDPSDFITPQANAWIDLPGGEKKFAATYDPVSGKFYALSNPVLATHLSAEIDNDPIPHGLIRNAAALLSSKDQYHWDVEQVFLYSPRIDNGNWGEAFQYLNFAIDGDDMAVVSRTAFDVDGDASNAGQNLPPSGHDSNLITFHRIDNFRTAGPKQILVADTLNNRVLRYEAGQAATMAPIGQFNLGATYNGTAMNNPTGVAQDPSTGVVYICEALDTGGRVLMFDAAGNFLNVLATSGTDFTGRPEALAVGPDGKLYMSVAFGGSDSDKVYKIDPDTQAVATFVDTNYSGGTLNNPRGIAFGPDGHLYVADSTNGKIRKFDGTTGAFIANIVSTTNPLGLVWDPIRNKLMFTAQAGSDLDVYETTLAGSVAKLYDPNDVGTGLGLADIDGNVYWSDYDKDDIYFLKDADSKINSVFWNVNGLSYMTPTAIVQPDAGERTWINGSDDEWEDLNNWYYWGRPDTSYEVAVFGSALNSNSSVTLDSDYTVAGLRFRNTNKYRIDGTGSLTIKAEPGLAGVIDAQLGTHEVDIPVTLGSDTNMTVAAGARFKFLADLDLNGRTLHITGPGQRDIADDFVMNGGTLITDGQNQISFASTANTTLNGTLRYVPWAGASHSVGSTHSLLNGAAYLDGTFTRVNLPALPGTRGWSTANLYTNGTVSIITATATPDWLVNANGDWDDSSNWYQHNIPNTEQEIAYFNNLITGNRTVTLNSARVVKGLRFADTNNDSYTISGAGSITITSGTGNGVLDVESGIHYVDVPVTLGSHTDWTNPSGTRLYLKDSLDLNGNTLTITGAGNRNVDGQFLMSSGKLVVDGRNQVTFGSTAYGTLNGTLQFLPYAGAPLTLGSSYDLFNGIEHLTGTFGTLQLPSLATGLGWDTSDLYTTGVITVVTSPEPAAGSMIVLGLAAASTRRRRPEGHAHFER